MDASTRADVCDVKEPSIVVGLKLRGPTAFQSLELGIFSVSNNFGCLWVQQSENGTDLLIDCLLHIPVRHQLNVASSFDNHSYSPERYNFSTV
jgi:hypothetical protein